MPDPKLHELYPHLFVRGHTLNIDSSTMLKALIQKHIRLVLNVSLRNDPYLESACRTIGIVYKFTPMHDNSAVDHALVYQLAEETLSYVRSGAGVLIHCDSGWNRSPLVALTAIVMTSPNPAEAILAEVRKVRPVLTNKTFERYILGLHK